MLGLGITLLAVAVLCAVRSVDAFMSHDDHDDLVGVVYAVATVVAFSAGATFAWVGAVALA